ncbi:MAG: sigma-70 family RNA polymerase sigma factor [Tenacibaculum sp.]|nr:sigma-70 family RNA polymerase sigma factor [Tenacibaculum sp.]
MNIENQFTDLYNTYAPKVYKLCLGYASGVDEIAKEWQQETFIKIWKHRNSFKGDASISTWIYRIAINTCLGYLRKSNRKFQPINENILTTPMDSSSETSTDKDIQKMYSCIDQLTKNNKTLILLELEEIPQATIAETTGISHGALRTRLSRIRKALLKCITNGK